MLRRAATTALILLVATCLLPQASVAIDGIKSFEIGHLNGRVGTSVEISSRDGRMSAIPIARVKEGPKPVDAAATGGEDIGEKTLAKIVPDGDISFSKGRKILNQVKEAVKQWKKEKTGPRSTALADKPSDRVESKAAEETQAAGTEADSRHQNIELCDNCNYRLVTNTSIH
jgi:hypothetical protein